MIVKPEGVSVSTAEAYRKLDEKPPSRSERAQRERFPTLLSELRAGEIPKTLYNDFERTAPDESLRAKAALLSLGAVSALMSGSGPSVYGLFRSLSEAEAARKALEAEGLGAWAVRFR